MSRRARLGERVNDTPRARVVAAAAFKRRALRGCARKRRTRLIGDRVAAPAVSSAARGCRATSPGRPSGTHHRRRTSPLLRPSPCQRAYHRCCRLASGSGAWEASRRWAARPYRCPSTERCSPYQFSRNDRTRYSFSAARRMASLCLIAASLTCRGGERRARGTAGRRCGDAPGSRGCPLLTSPPNRDGTQCRTACPGAPCAPRATHSARPAPTRHVGREQRRRTNPAFTKLCLCAMAATKVNEGQRRPSAPGHPQSAFSLGNLEKKRTRVLGLFILHLHSSNTIQERSWGR